MNSKELLGEHFDRLKELVPEVYSKSTVSTSSSESDIERLYTLMKRTLGIIEAVYFQDREMFHSARVEEYGKIINELKELGFEYKGNPELLEKATNALLLSVKKPMEKAGQKGSSQEEREAM